MRVGINVHFQYSFFSSGSSTVAFSLAAALKALGHTPVLVNLNGTSEWYDDVKDMKGLYEQCNMCQWGVSEPFDIFIDIDGFIIPEERRRLAKKIVIFLRRPAFLSLSELTVYPVGQPLQILHMCDEIWTWDTYDTKDSHLLEILTKKPVFRIPYTWCHRAVEAYRKDVPAWSGGMGEWEIHGLETNMTMANNSTLPLVALAYAYSNSQAKFNKVFIHNSEKIESQAFFKDNVLAHCRRPGLDYNFVGRIRCSDICRTPKTAIISHLRFMTVKGALLDCAWNGIPIIHNSPFLKAIGLERYYYSDNSVLGVNEAMNNLEEDYKAGVGMFAGGFLEGLRKNLVELFDASKKRSIWEGILTGRSVAPVKTELVIGFSDVYDSFNYEYNFWTLLLNEAGKHLVPQVKVRGVDARTVKEIDLLMFGPFGQVWKDFTCPKIHFTGENTRPVDGVMNLGFNSGHNSFRFLLCVTEAPM